MLKAVELQREGEKLLERLALMSLRAELRPFSPRDSALIRFSLLPSLSGKHHSFSYFYLSHAPEF